MGKLRAEAKRCRHAVMAALVIGGAPALAAERRPISEVDLLRFVWPADPQLSPDGAQIAFVRVHVDEEKDRYETALFIAPFDGTSSPRPFTSGPFDSSPSWSPDGKQLVFVRAREKSDGTPEKGQLHLMPADGGEPRALTDLPKGASSPRWSPDGKTIAFITTTRAEDLQKKDAGSKPAKPESDVRVVTRATYRSNGSGYSEPGRNEHIWLVDVPAPGSDDVVAPRQLTTGEFDEENPAWSPDGSRLYFTSTRVLEPYYQPDDADLYAVPAAGGEIELVASIDGSIGAFAPAPDGRRIAFVGTQNVTPVRSYDQPDLFVTNTAPGATPRNLTAEYDFDIGAGVSGDQHAPRASRAGGVFWTRDGRSVIVRSVRHGAANLVRVAVATGKVEPFTEGDHEVIGYTASADRKKAAVIVATPTSIGDVFVADMSKAPLRLRPVTRVNQALFDELDVTEPEAIWYASFDGVRIQAWILKPPGFDASRKYPMILEIHGGPHAPYGYAFTHEFLWIAAKGYVVLYTNPRGSTSYGQEFGNLIQFHYPGDDFRDLMAGVDEVLARGYVDEKHIGVTGGSGGGVLTNWAIAHTDRFAAAVSQRSIADWAGFWYTADFTLFQPSWFRGAPWEDPEDFTVRSPITHIANVNTPLMLIEGEADMRTPPGDGGEAMFRALKYLKKPVVMVRFPGETHELSRSGKPSHRVERLRHIVGWFDKYLQGMAVEGYDVR